MTGPTLTGAVHHVNLSVTDLEASAAWYRRVLGFEPLAAAPDPEGRWDKVILRHPSGLLLGLSAHRENRAEKASEFRTGLDHLALAVPDAASLDAWQARLDEEGVPHSEIKATPLGRLVVVRDPDNVQLELYAPNPQ